MEKLYIIKLNKKYKNLPEYVLEKLFKDIKEVYLLDRQKTFVKNAYLRKYNIYLCDSYKGDWFLCLTSDKTSLKYRKLSTIINLKDFEKSFYLMDSRKTEQAKNLMFPMFRERYLKSLLESGLITL